jgi:hypothetical protein
LPLRCGEIHHRRRRVRANYMRLLPVFQEKCIDDEGE